MWNRFFKPDNHQPEDDGNHEEMMMVEVNTPENFMVTLEVEDPEDGSIIDACLIVPKGSINHFTYVLQYNGVPHRVDPIA